MPILYENAFSISLSSALPVEIHHIILVVIFLQSQTRVSAPQSTALTVNLEDNAGT
jgi:hypothetical protein